MTFRQLPLVVMILLGMVFGALTTYTTVIIPRQRATAICHSYNRLAHADRQLIAALRSAVKTAPNRTQAFKDALDGKYADTVATIQPETC